MTVSIYGQKTPCARAVKGPGFVRLYDHRGAMIMECTGITDFAGYAIEGGAWDTPEPAPDEDRDGMLVELDYRMTLVELGVSTDAV